MDNLGNLGSLCSEFHPDGRCRLGGVRHTYIGYSHYSKITKMPLSQKMFACYVIDIKVKTVLGNAVQGEDLSSQLKMH